MIEPAKPPRLPKTIFDCADDPGDNVTEPCDGVMEKSAPLISIDTNKVCDSVHPLAAVMKTL